MKGTLTHDVLLELAGERYFERGEGYDSGGHVRGIVEHGGTIAAKVLGTYEYHVRLWIEDDELDYSCDCPLGVDGVFCKHCVAVGLAWLKGEAGHGLSEAGAGPVTMDDVRAYLEEQDRNVLVHIVMEQAMEDERLRERLLLRAARARAVGPPTSPPSAGPSIASWDPRTITGIAARLVTTRKVSKTSSSLSPRCSRRVSPPRP